MSVDLFCEIYADKEANELQEGLRQLITEKNGVFYAHDNEIVVQKNLSFDSVKRKDFPDGFSHFEQRIEIFPDESKEVSLENQITLVSMILKHLWSQNIPAVAACDYEDQLPENGGYKSRQIPWTT